MYCKFFDIKNSDNGYGDTLDFDKIAFCKAKQCHISTKDCDNCAYCLDSEESICDLCREHKPTKTVTILDCEVTLCDSCFSIAVNFADEQLRKRKFERLRDQYITECDIEEVYC